MIRSTSECIAAYMEAQVKREPMPGKCIAPWPPLGSAFGEG